MASIDEGEDQGSDFIDFIDNNQEDSDYEGICKPPILRQLRNILDQYPDGSQIIRELVQNAEDAGARSFEIFYKEGNNIPAPQASKFSYRGYFRTPALCVHNDGVFTAEDWKGIKSIYTSVKEKDALKVGRFGLGFKSIFHITDSPIIISGDQLLIINPMELPHRVCHKIPFRKLKTPKYKEAWSLMRRTLGLEGEGLFGLNEAAIDNQQYPKTLFWFPLRQKESELSNKIYTSEKMTELFESFEEEAETILLFLKSVNLVSIYDTQFRKKFEVNLKGIGNEDITEKREYIKNQVKGNDLPAESLWSEYKAVLTTWKLTSQQETTIVQEWLVVNHFRGENDMVDSTMLELAQDVQLGYAPYVGVAFPLTREMDRVFNGHVFCFLPLPIEPDGRSLTNLPVHVNGFFALTSNRRHMLWASHDQHESDDNRLKWNHLLISEVLSVAYIRLVKLLLEDSRILPEIIYSSLPNSETIDLKWSILLQPIYTEVLHMEIFYTESGDNQNGRMLSFEDALFFCFDRETEKVSKEVEETLWKVLSVYTDDLVRLPHHLQFIIDSKDFLRTKPRTINAKLVCSFLLKDPRYRSFQKSQKLHILQYLLDNTRVDQYENIQLLPTNDPTTCVSIKNDMETVYICLNGEEKMFPLLDRQLISSVPENKIVIDQLKRKVFSSGATGNFGIKEFSSPDFVPLLECSIEKQKISDGIPQSKKPEILTWISEIWQYLSKNEDLIENVQHLNILAETEGEKNVSVVQLHVLDGLYVLKRQGSSSISGAVCDVLQSFGVTLLNALPGFMPNAFVEKYVCSPSTSGVCDVLVKLLRQTTNERYLVQKIELLSASKRKQFAVFMSQANYLDGIVKNFLKNLKIFPVIPIKNHNTLCSLTEVDKITPPNYKEYPISLPNTMIDGEFKGIQLAFMLECSRWTDEQLTLSILSRIKDNKICGREKIDAFMDFFLNRIQFATPEQIQMSTVIPFIESDDGKIRKPQELFEITENLQKLFYGEKDRFPKNHKLVNKHINGLRTLGLKSSINISINDLMKTLNFITENNTTQSKETKLKLKVFEKFVNQLVRPIDSALQNVQEILGKMRSSSWMSPKNIKPKHYPQKIQWFCGENKLQTPGEMYHSEYEMLVGSVALVAESSLNSELLDYLLHQKPSSDLVLEQLLILSVNYNDCTNRSEFLQMLTTIYDYLANDRLPQSTVDVYREKNIVWTGKVFAKPKDVFIEFINDSTEMTLEPFMYQIQPDKETHKLLFSQLGCLDRIEVENILNILHDIKKCQKGLSWEKSKHNLLVVEGILNVLEELNDKNLLSGDEIDRILFPVKTRDNLFELLPAKECTYVDYKRENDEIEDDEEDLKFVHTKIRSSMAENLGVPSLTRRIVEIKGVEDIPWGQKEELTDRLKNLIEEYADGISVLKEMIQNADDAGATCLRILYDERINENAKIGLIDKGMAECQGPAIWVYNDAKFEEKDFQNIIKLGAGTKMADLTKIGKFGLGFCSVYNITDVPSILSGDSLVILDPRMIHLGKALKDNNPGLRFRISDSKTRHRLRHQLRPFNNIFGCDFQSERTVMSYEGTLFRFPLRTAKQADETKSQISPKQYTKDDVAKLIYKFIEDAGNLMLFIQNVNKIEFFHLQTQASEPHLFYSITRCFQNDKSNILVKANPLDIQRKQPIQTVENICISIKMHEGIEQLHQLFKQETITKKSSDTKWVIVWQIGTNAQSLPYKNTKNNVIVGGLAIPVMHSLKECTEVKQSVMPFGFYPRGHVFCFLPLPQESYIPVHVNGYFAVESSRRRLVSKYSDNLNSEGADWNIFLLKNVICDSYLCLLEKLADLFPKENCYENWPHQGKDNMMNELVISFYENLVTSKRKLVYMDQDSSDIKRYSFIECVFLNPVLRYESEAKICEKALECFLRFNSYEPQKHAMDLPRDTYEQLKMIPTCLSKLEENICDIKTFYLDSFFPSLSTEFWNQSTEERNKLILLAFNLENEEVKHVIRETHCIPTQPYGKLRKPSELIYPDPFNNSFCISRLFSENDERFPSEEFNKSSIVKELKIMGMMTDTLTNELVIDRVKSVKRLAKQSAKMTERCNYMLQYLELKLETHKEVQQALQNIKFLPVLQKPSSWPFKWAATESKKFESGKKLSLKNCKNVAGCVSPIVNLDGRFDRVLKYLGVQGTTDIGETVVLNQFQEITRLTSNEKLNEIWEIYRDVYAYLNETDRSFLSTFEDQCCLLTKSGLVKPNTSALELRCDLEPFLFKVDDRWKCYENFLRCIGVKKTFSVHCLFKTLKTIDPKEGETSKHVFKIIDILNMLSDTKRRGDFQSICDLETILLPDKNKIMRKPSDLCIDDDRNIETKDNTFLFVHGDLNAYTTSLFEIKSKCAQFIKRFAGAVSFGQSEALVTRLKGILEDYPCNVSILNELIQNADDAGATEIHFVHDQRFHPTELIFDKKLADTQGPSLVVYNNSCFSKSDIEGISKLGEGSKRLDPMTTGQFGIGFNAVYHITDVPSFLTIGKTVPNGGALVMFDPHCEYVPLATLHNPGMMIENIQRIEDNFPDMYRAYLTKEISRITGTWFRFPLRTTTMAKKSKIKSKFNLTNQTLQQWFSSLEDDIPKSLLFLSNIVNISISVISSDGQFQQIASVSAERAPLVKEKLQKFNSDAKRYVDTLQSGENSLLEKGVSLQYQQELNISIKDKTYKEMWCVSQVCGVLADRVIDKMLLEGFRSKEVALSPRGGVAYEITIDSDSRSSRAFNFLPLPIMTYLPVHVNSHFAVNSARTSIWENNKPQEHLKGIWNSFLLEHVIPFAYIELVCFLRDNLFQITEMNIKNTMRVYNSSFPILKTVENTRWKTVVVKFYQLAFDQKVEIFPIFLPSDVCGSLCKSHHFLIEKMYKVAYGACVSFLSLKIDNHQFPSYICPQDSDSDLIPGENALWFDSDLATLLKLLGLKLLDCSRDIAESVQSIFQMPESVLPFLCITDIMEFLRSWNSNAEDKCRISKVGVPITETLFKNIHTLRKLVEVCFGSRPHEHPKDLEGIPLCIQNDNVLQVFSKKNNKFVSEFCDLFPNSSHKFLHVDFANIFQNKLPKTEDYLKPLDIEHFSKLLSDDFKKLHSNKPIPLIENAENKKWFLRCWKFLSVSHQKCNIEAYDAFLSSWCLIPVTTRSKRELYPFKMRFAILDARSFLETTGDVSNENHTIGKILSNLDIPSPLLEYIDTSFKARQTVRSLCASENSPEIILDCMIYHKKSIGIKDAKDLLIFLYNKLRNYFSKLESKFRDVILYKSFDGTLTNLDTTGDIIVIEAECVPKSGLELFCKHKNLKILENNVYLYELYEKLSLEKIDSISFYEKYFLRYPEYLDHESRMRHIHYINENGLFEKGSDLMQNLIKNFPFVKNAKTKRLQKVCDFFTPYPRICRRMFTEEELLPLDPFKDEKWKEFLIYAGLKIKIPLEMLLRFAKDIERRQENENDENLCSDSKLLMNEILKIPNLYREEQFLRALRGIKFLNPSNVKIEYLQILGAFKTDTLISIENAVYPESELMTWSMCKILPDLKWQNIEHSWKVEEMLLIKRIPDLRDVISHVHQLCYEMHLAVKNKQSNTKLVRNVGKLHEFMELIYTKLKHLAASDNAVKEMKIGFSETPLFYNDKKNCFLRWDQMVLELRREDEISTYLCRGSEIFGAHFDFFRKLGVTNEATYLHYVRVFHVLKSLIGDRPLMCEELSVCQKAMNGLLESVDKVSHLSMNEEEKFDKLNEFHCVYLPTDANRLEKSFGLTICDIPDFEERLTNVNDIQFVKKAHSSYSRNKLLLLLPSNFRPKCISQQVKEVVCKKDECKSSEEIRNLNKRIHKKEFMEALFAIFSLSTSIRDSEKEHYRLNLERLYFEQVSDLETVLIYKSNGVEIRDSNKSKEMFYDPDDSVVFIKIKQGTSSLFRYVRDLAFDAIVKCTSDVTNQYQTPIKRLLESETVDEINEVLSGLKVSVELKWEPELGSYVPVDLHDYLENSIKNLRPNEIVALEILNPAFDEVADYVYIYVKIIKKNDTNMFPMYEINDGSKLRPEIAFKLYRFVPADNETPSRELERYTDLGGEAYQTRKGVIFEEIKMTLIEAWKYGQQDFRRVKNRILLNWHPDRHPNNPIATEITQYILEIWRRLKNGEFKEQVQNCSESFTRQRNFYYRHRKNTEDYVFYGERKPTHAQPRREDDDGWINDYANRSRHLRRRNYSGWAFCGGGGGTSSEEYQPNPQPQIGKLWFKQAKYNMKAALVEREQSVSSDWGSGMNWICYKCHLTIDTSLKSLLYRQDAQKAYDNLKNHDLVSLSHCLSIPELTEACRRFRSEVCDNQDLMIYPAVSHVPGEAFTAEQGEGACRIAQEIIDLCDEHWGT